MEYEETHNLPTRSKPQRLRGNFQQCAAMRFSVWKILTIISKFKSEKRRKIVFVLLCCVLFCAIPFCAAAQAPEAEKVLVSEEIVDLGDGITKATTIHYRFCHFYQQ